MSLYGAADFAARVCFIAARFLTRGEQLDCGRFCTAQIK